MSFPIATGNSGFDVGYSVSTFSDGSSIITGIFSGTVSFGETNLTSSPEGPFGYDIFITKLDNNGNYLWARQAGGSSADFGNCVTTLSDGSSIITGSFQGTASFGTTNLNASGANDIFIAKLDSDGKFLWAKQAGGSESDIAYAISSLSDGSSIITGAFDGNASFGSTTLTSAGDADIFIAKLDLDGNFLWAKQAGGSSYEAGESISSLSDGSSIITGNFQGNTSFGSTNLTSAGKIDVFIAKLDTDGNYLWAKQAGGSERDIGDGISSLSDGSSIITGFFEGNSTFGSTNLTSAGKLDIFISKLDSNGNFLWAKQAGGTSTDLGYAVSTLSNGDSIITGQFQGTAQFGSTSLNSAGGADAFIAKIDNDGNYLWSKQAGSISGSEEGLSISTLSNGSSITTGHFESTASFGESALTSSGMVDIFISALDADGNWITSLAPSLTSATYNISSGVLTATGSNFVANSGSNNDIDSSKLTLTGDGSNTFTLTSDDVELTSDTAFSVSLSAADQLQVAGLLNKNGSISAGGTTYNIAAASGWNPGASTSPADATGNAMTISNVVLPSLSFATYNDATGNLTVTGSNLPAYPGASNDIDISKLTITGGNNGTYTLTSTDVELTSATKFSLTLSNSDQTQLDSLLNQKGTSSSSGTAYNLAAADHWAPAADSSVDIADATGNAITVSNLVNVAPTGSVTISGTATQGQTLTAANTLTDPDGLGSITNQWKRAGAAITGATATSYELVQADVGSVISVMASYTDGKGTAESVTSSATSAVANVNDAPTGSVTISGTAKQGETLTATNTLADADGLGTITNQWNRAGAAISGAMSNSYELVQADVGSAISVTASYTDGQGTAESVTSSATSAVKALPIYVPPSSPEEKQQVDANSKITDADDSILDQADVNLRMMGGNDYVEITGGINNFVNGNQGDDRFVLRAGQKGQYLGGKGADTFEVFGGIDAYANGQKGADQMILRGGLGRYLGGDDGDRIEVFAIVSGSWVNGNRGEDTIIGSVAGVTYRGGADADLMIVSQGDVWGDKGPDTFRGVKGEGYAVIQDYSIGEDVVDLDMEGSWSRFESGLMFTDDSGDQIMLLLGISDIAQISLA